MHFYLVVLKIVVVSNACVENYQKNPSIISYLRFSLLSPFNSDARSYTKFLQLKSTNKNARNIIYKVKSYFPQPVQGARHIILLYVDEN